MLVALSRFGAAKALICVIWGIAAGSRSQLQPKARVDWLELGRVILKCDPSSACVEPKTCTSYNKPSYSVWMLERCLERCQYPCKILYLQRKLEFRRGFELLSFQMHNRPHAGFAVLDLDPRLFNLHKYEAPYYTLLEMSVWPTAVLSEFLQHFYPFLLNVDHR